MTSNSKDGDKKSATNPHEKRDPPPKDSGQIYNQNALKT